MSEAESKIVPNSFQTPNAYVDEAMHLLTPEEYVVLSFIDRHILGWQEKVMERKGVISLTMIVDGYQSKKTGRWFHGTGLSRPTVNKCLDALTCYGFIVPEGRPTTKGQTWVLGDYPDYSALRERYDSKKREASARMAKVRGKSDLPVNDIDGALVNATDPQGGISHLRKQRHLERQSSKTEKKELTTSAATRQSAVSPVNDWSLDQEADDASMFSPKGKKQISAQAENGRKRLSKPTATTPPLVPPVPPKDVDTVQTHAAAMDTGGRVPAKRKPNRMATIIDGIWGKGVSGALLPMLMGRAKKKPHADYNIEGGMTEVELFAFGRWYRKQNPGLNMPETPYKVEGSIESFRNAVDYEGWMAEGEKLFPVFFPKEDAPPPVVEDRATPEEVAEYRQQIQALGLDDVFGDMFDDYKENIS